MGSNQVRAPCALELFDQALVVVDAEKIAREFFALRACSDCLYAGDRRDGSADQAANERGADFASAAIAGANQICPAKPGCLEHQRKLFRNGRHSLQLKVASVGRWCWLGMVHVPNEDKLSCCLRNFKKMPNFL